MSTTDNTVAESNAGELPVGICWGSNKEYDSDLHAASGDVVRLQPGRIMLVEAGGTVTAGDYVATDADGKVVTQTTQSAVVGIALQAGTSGAVIEVWFNPYDSGRAANIVAVTATTGGGTTGLIPATADGGFVTITSDDADKQVTLPSNVVGMVIRGMIGATGCEFICADAGAKINDLVCGATNEAAMAADQSWVAECISSTEWILRAFTKLGADVPAIVPDVL
jgi:hypothetical protein